MFIFREATEICDNDYDPGHLPGNVRHMFCISGYLRKWSARLLPSTLRIPVGITTILLIFYQYEPNEHFINKSGHFEIEDDGTVATKSESKVDVYLVDQYHDKY